MLKFKSKGTPYKVIQAPQQPPAELPPAPAETHESAGPNGNGSKKPVASVSHSVKPIAHTVSSKKLAANQKNAQESTGPKTAVGKTSSSWSAIKHGLLSKRLMELNHQTAKEFSDFLTCLRQDVKPVGVLEEVVVEDLAHIYFRKAALAKYENDESYLTILSTQAGGNLLRYQAMINRQFSQAIDRLERLQRQRRGEDIPAPLSVQVLHEVAGIEGDEISG